MAKSRQQGTLDLSDLHELPAHLHASILTDQLEANWLAERERCPNNPSLIRATLRTAGWKHMLLGLLLLFSVGAFDYRSLRVKGRG